MNIIKNRRIFIALSLIVIAIGLGFMFYNKTNDKGFLTMTFSLQVELQ